MHGGKDDPVGSVASPLRLQCLQISPLAAPVFSPLLEGVCAVCTIYLALFSRIYGLGNHILLKNFFHIAHTEIVLVSK